MVRRRVAGSEPTSNHLAEGVEDRAMLPALALMGVDRAQGYALGRPHPVGLVFGEAGLTRTAA